MNESSRTTELLLTVSKDARGTLGAQIEGQLRTRIRDGALRAGTELPSTRDLARQLGISRRVVVDAYAQLTAEGYLSVRQGARPRVAAPAVDASPAAAGLGAAGRGDPVRLPAQHARRDDLPAGGLGPLPAKRRDDDHRRRSELRRPARRRGAPLGTRRLPRPRAWRRRHDRERRDHERLHAGAGRHLPRALPGGRTADRARVAGRSRVRHDRPARRARAGAGARRRRWDPGRAAARRPTPTPSP